MFGILKYQGCRESDEQRYEHRLHYCGTCKTIGALHGQSSRFLLNNDIVFLAELLTSLSSAACQPLGWDKAYQSFNCMTLPKEPVTMPLPLQIAAHVTVILTEFKIRDQIIDSGFAAWKFASKLFSSTFERAAVALTELKFPIEEFYEIILDQQRREQLAPSMVSGCDLPYILDFCAAPTSVVTGEVFHRSVDALALEDQSLAHRARSIGSALGRLVYVLDAVEDFDKDVKRSQFNPLVIVSTGSGASSPDMPRVFEYARQLVHTIDSELRRLPISANKVDSFRQRLTSGVTSKLGSGWQHACMHSCKHVNAASHQCASNSDSLSDRWNTACTLAKTSADRSSSQLHKLLLAPLVTGVAFCFTQQAKQAHQTSDLLSIPFNLIAWTGLINEIGVASRKALVSLRQKPGASQSTTLLSIDPREPHDSDQPPDLDPEKPKRSKRKFSDHPNSEPLPEIIERPDEESENPGEEKKRQNPNQPENPEDDRRRYDQGAYVPDPPYRYRQYNRPGNSYNFCCMADCCARCGCDCCCDGCQLIQCCGGGTECCTGGTSCCGGADCCASGGGADCCAGGGGADSCAGGGGADCCSGGADCCGGGGCGDFGSACGDCGSGCS